MAAALATAYQLPPEEPDDSRQGTMSFLEHLDELRKRIIRSCLAAGIGMVVAFVFINRIVAFVLAPMRHALPPGTTLIYTKPAEAFSLHINVALIAGTLLAAPFIMFQVWRFIAPGLYANEKKFANQMIFAAPMIGLYLMSIGIAWLVGPKRERTTSSKNPSSAVQLVFAAAVIDRTRRSGRRSPIRLSRRN
jgi:Sec-independent protein secretion pathway component TatC